MGVESAACIKFCRLPTGIHLTNARFIMFSLMLPWRNKLNGAAQGGEYDLLTEL